ncbi:MAG: hypothetical protein ACKVWV_20240 [Planctomycetota bacterium]
MHTSRFPLALVALVAVAVVVWLALAPHDASSELQSPSPTSTREHTDVLSAPLERERREFAAPPVVASALEATTTAAKSIDELPPGDHDDFPPRIESPADAFEVQVEDRDGPLVAIDVELWEPTDDRQSEWPTPGSAGWRSMRTDSSGLATFRPPPTKHCGVRVTTSGGIVITRHVDVFPEDTKRYRVFVRFGNAAVFGRVHTQGGTPDSNAEVWMIQGGDQRVVRTDARGEYRFERVRERFTLVLARSTPVRSDDGGLDVFTVEVGRARFVPRVGEVRRVDFGSVKPPSTWSGRFVTSDGSEVHWPLEFHVDEVTQGHTMEITTDARGTFSIELQPGTYRAAASLAGSSAELARIAITERHLVRDLVVPGVCVRGNVRYEGEHANAPYPPPVRILLRRVEPRNDVERSAPIARDAYALFGLERAVYRVRVVSNATFLPTPKATIAGAPAEGLELDLRYGAEVRVQDLVIVHP